MSTLSSYEVTIYFPDPEISTFAPIPFIHWWPELISVTPFGNLDHLYQTHYAPSSRQTSYYPVVIMSVTSVKIKCSCSNISSDMLDLYSIIFMWIFHSMPSYCSCSWLQVLWRLCIAVSLLNGGPSKNMLRHRIILNRSAIYCAIN